MNYAILDIGSNTIKMTIFSEEGEILLRKSTAAGLISYVKNGILTEEGITLLADIMLQYDKIARNTGADRLYPFATASLRAASNHQEVIDEIEKRTSYRIDLVSGEQEAALSYYGVCKTLPAQKDAMILLDIGGGSCEIVAPQCSLAVSLPVGAIYVCGEDEIDFSKHCIYKIEAFTACNEDPIGYFETHREDWQDSILILQDIFCGVVPMGAENRAWRQRTGRLAQYLSKEAKQVSRIFCGLEQRLK